MASARYWKITVNNKAISSALEISAIRFHNQDVVIDYETATVTSNRTPVSGSLNILLRTTPIDQEVIIFPACKGYSYFLFDLKVAKEINAFRIGFGSTDQLSLTKFSLSYSTDAKKFTLYESIGEDLKLKFNTPHTLSNLRSSNDAYPSFFHRNINEKYELTNKSFFIDVEKRRLFTGLDIDKSAGGQNSLFFLPISGWLKTNKFYFEVSSESILNLKTIGSIYFGIGFRNGSDSFFSLKRALVFELTGDLSGKLIDKNTLTVTGLTVPVIDESYKKPIGGKTGFQGSFCLDLLTRKVSQNNSPFAPTFNYKNLENSTSGIAVGTDIFFFLYGADYNTYTNCDLTFNFGQNPWQVQPPVGFDSRIGYRWELTLDPEWTNISVPLINSLSINPPVLYNKPLIDDFFPPSNFNDYAVDVSQTYYIKGVSKSSGNVFTKKAIKLFTYPEYSFIRETVTNGSDGTYEFIDIEYRTYAIISSDLLSKVMTDEVIAPIHPKPMENI